MADKDFLLQFQEFDDAESGPARPSRDTAVNIDDDASSSQNQRRVTGVTQDDTDPLESDDKSELLSGQRKSAAFWTLEYYQAFFDVETHQVKQRILGSVVPWLGKNFLRLNVRKNPDLYGPFWICATLVFAIGMSGNMSSFLVHHGNPGYKYVPEFSKVTMAAVAIYSYAWLVPLALWGFLTWRNAKVSSAVSYSFLEIVCVYGYSLSIYIPAVVLWVIPSNVLRWCSILVALCQSGSVLVLTFWPAVRDERPRVALAIITAILTLHALLAVGCKAYFFSAPAPVKHVGTVEATKALLLTKGN